MPESIADTSQDFIAPGPSDLGNVEAIAVSEQTNQPLTVEELQKQLDTEKRRASTYEGNARSLREKEQNLQGVIDQQSEQLRQAMERFEALETNAKASKINAAIDKLRDEGHSEQEIQFAKALVQEQDRLDKAQKDLEAREARLKPTLRDVEIRTYFDKSLDRANTKLTKYGIEKPITEKEVRTLLKGEPKEQQDIEAVVQDLILERTHDKLNANRSTKLDDRAKAGIDPQPKGGKTIGTLADAEKALMRKEISQSEFARQYGRIAVKQRIRGYV